MKLTRTVLCALLAATVGLGLGACGTAGDSGRPNEDATLLLDFTPGAVHTGIYLARSRGFDEAEGVRLEIKPPSDSTDAVRLLSAGRADLAILDIHDLALAREKGADIVAVMPIVQRPLASIVASSEISRPRDLEGRRVGVTGLPSDVAVLRSIVRGDGGDPALVKTTTIGFTAVAALLGGKVDAATAFWNAEGVALQQQRPDTKIFRVDDYGAPAYPELVLCAASTTVQDRASLVRAAVTALKRGYEEALVDPESAVSALIDQQDGLDRDAIQRDFDAVAPAFTSGPTGFGVFGRDAVTMWAAWESEVGITKEPVNVALAFPKL